MLFASLIASILSLQFAAFADSTLGDPSRMNLEIENAFRTDQGDIILDFRDERPGLPNPKFMEVYKSFVCHQNTCSQIAPKQRSKSQNRVGTTARTETFEYGQGKRGEWKYDMDKGIASMSCDGKSSKLHALSGSEKTQLTAKLKTGALVLNSLPNRRETAYVLKDPKSGSLIVIQRPRFHLHSFENYVYEGKPGQLKQIDTLNESTEVDKGAFGSTRIPLADGRMIEIPSQNNTTPTVGKRSYILLGSPADPVDTTSFGIPDVLPSGSEGIPCPDGQAPTKPKPKTSEAIS